MAKSETPTAPQGPDAQMLEFIAGLLALEDAKVGDRVALAARIGLPGPVAARVLGMSVPAARKALQRAKLRKRKT